jgi:uncharacterized surface protein with fasciclin (FAS1) repeats
LSDGFIIDTLEAVPVEVSIDEDGIFKFNAEAVEVDILANNGIVHKIDTVLNWLLVAWGLSTS